MASYDGIDLADGAAAAFEVSSPRLTDTRTIALGNRAHLTLSSVSQSVIVTGIQGQSFDEVYAEALSLVARGLDLVHAHHGPPVLIDQDDQPVIVAWPGRVGQTVRVSAYARPSFRFSATAEVRDPDGRLVTAPKPEVHEWHPSFRYYRLAEASTDLFDSFRNTYLAIESIVSSIVPPRPRPDGGSESETSWIERAFREIAQDVDLSQFAPSDSNREPHNAIVDDLYRNFRTAIFHAKTDRPVIAPHDHETREKIIEARARYARLFRTLAERHTRARYVGGGLSIAGWDIALGAIATDLTAFVSEDATSVADEPPGEYKVAPAGGRWLEFADQPTVDASTARQRQIVATALGEELEHGIGAVRRFGVLRGGVLAMVESLRGALILSPSDTLQISFIVAGRDNGGPRIDFDS